MAGFKDKGSEELILGVCSGAGRSGKVGQADPLAYTSKSTWKEREGMSFPLGLTITYNLGGWRSKARA